MVAMAKAGNLSFVVRDGIAMSQCGGVG